ncbi:transposase [Nonomuraea phyllanthi]|uniref:Transposase n=1 Tax=Nonomuraea phyllanthi TaxID=2219224 RepID=A0A5C4VXP4_9ACTN|nr:transposase [Nonomuraea phyllanthi]KAB8190663.1 transposase [Nonomuraea phyllanthi]QFY05837.1 transposase [Nonomuraea phyllanthi]
MERRWVGLDGYEVVGVVRGGRQVLRVRRHGRVVADCTSVAEVAGHLDLADLCEVIDLPARRRAGECAEARTSSHHR